MDDNILVFYGTPDDKRNCYKYLKKYSETEYKLVWFNSFENQLFEIPLGGYEIDQIVNFKI